MVFKCASHGTAIILARSNPAVVSFWVWWGPWGHSQLLGHGWGQGSQWRAAARRWPQAGSNAGEGAQVEGHHKGLELAGPVAARRQHQEADGVLLDNDGSSCSDSSKKCTRAALDPCAPSLVPLALLPFGLGLCSLEITPPRVLRSCVTARSCNYGRGDGAQRRGMAPPATTRTASVGGSWVWLLLWRRLLLCCCRCRCMRSWTCAADERVRAQQPTCGRSSRARQLGQP